MAAFLWGEVGWVERSETQHNPYKPLKFPIFRREKQVSRLRMKTPDARFWVLGRDVKSLLQTRISHLVSHTSYLVTLLFPLETR